MPVSVPTNDEYQAAISGLQDQVDTLAEQVDNLTERVTALEAGTTPPDPVDPPDEIDPPDPEPTPEPPDPPPPGTLQVVVMLGGQQLVYNEAEGRDIGTYADPDGRFSERCTRITRDDTPLRVDVRRMDGRTSVVFAQGYWQDAEHVNLGAYTATIQGDELPAPVLFNVPSHAAYQRTRWTSSDWPLPMRKLADLYDRKLLPRFDPGLLRGTGISYGHVTYTPMGLAGFTGYMPQTGGRGDIGHVTGWQGSYICNPDDTACLNDVLAGGEAGGTFTWDFCDRATGAVIDPVVQYPTATLYNANVGTPFITYSSGTSAVGVTYSGTPGTILSPNGNPPQWHYWWSSNNVQGRVPVDTIIPDSGSITIDWNEVFSGTPDAGPGKLSDYWGNDVTGTTANVDIVAGTFAPGSGITIDSAHMPACSYLPFLLTGDPYHLENLQRQCAFIVMESPSAPVRSYGAAQSRAAGWSGRTLAACAKVSPESPPSWLLPRSTFLKAINTWVDDYVYPETVQNPAPHRAVLHLMASGYMDTGDGNGATSVQLYQEDLGAGGWGWLALLHPETKWLDVAHWQCQQTIARCDGKSGWSCEYPTAYTAQMLPQPDAPAFGSWGEAWAANAVAFGTTEDDCATEVPVPDAGSYDYWTHMSAAMAIAWQAGCTENADALSRLLTAITTGLEQGGGRQMEPNRAIAGPVS